MVKACKAQLDTNKCLGRGKPEVQAEKPLPQLHCRRSPLDKIVAI